VRRRAVALLPILGLVIAATSSCATAPWVITPGHPTVHVLVSSGCSATLEGVKDVVNSYAGDDLVPPDPVSGMICRYRAGLPEPDVTGAPRSLYVSVALDADVATHLATVIDAISTLAPQGTTSCPADFESASIIAFAYASRADVDLWFSDSGCDTLDNGRIGAFEEGNPSFYSSFLTLVNQLAPQQFP
jgi:hypothetical protein